MLKRKILVIDDEEKIRAFMRISLNAEGYTCIEASDAASGLSVYNQHKPNLVILDLGLPDSDGFRVLRKIRQSSKVPVLILSARDQESEKVKLLEGGANDYLTKPFGIRELIARINVLLRDMPYQPLPNFLVFKNLVIDLNNQTITCNNNEIALTKKEKSLLFRLVESPGKLIAQSELLTEIWGSSHIDDSHYLRILVAQLRKKLGDDADSPHFIRTEPGIGYRFIGEPVSEAIGDRD